MRKLVPIVNLLLDFEVRVRTTKFLRTFCKCEHGWKSSQTKNQLTQIVTFHGEVYAERKTLQGFRCSKTAAHNAIDKLRFG